MSRMIENDFGVNLIEKTKGEHS